MQLAALAIGLSATLATAPELAPAKLYNGVGRPLIVELRAEPDVTCTLTLLDASSEVVGAYFGATAGTFDIAAAIPAVTSITRACYLQALVGDEPMGTPLVVQPMLGRPPLRTMQDVRSDGKTAYTRIIGWGDELLDAGNKEHAALQAEWKPGEPIVMSGLRVYPESDVMLETSLGIIRVAMRPDEAPNTAWNMLELTRNGFYDGTIFHRIVPADRLGRPFVIQGGDPTGSGDGGPGYELPMEPSKLKHDFGVISMARADDPDSAGSQFFFGLSREGTERLDGQYCAFGYAVTGADVILAIANLQIANPETGRPKDPAMIARASLVPAPPRRPGFGRPDTAVRLPSPLPPRGAPPKDYGGKVPR